MVNQTKLPLGVNNPLLSKLVIDCIQGPCKEVESKFRFSLSKNSWTWSSGSDSTSQIATVYLKGPVVLKSKEQCELKAKML